MSHGRTVEVPCHADVLFPESAQIHARSVRRRDFFDLRLRKTIEVKLDENTSGGEDRTLRTKTAVMKMHAMLTRNKQKLMAPMETSSYGRNSEYWGV